jgi:hypothetical protein
VSINECLVEKKKCCLTKKLLNSKYLKITHYMVEKHCRYISSKLGGKKIKLPREITHVNKVPWRQIKN